MIFVQYVLPYLFTFITALCAGLITYLQAIKKCKLDNDIKIKEIQEQHKLDQESREKNFKLEIEKINLQHQNELEKIKAEGNNQLTNSLASNLMSSLFSNPQAIKDLIELGNKAKEDKK